MVFGKRVALWDALLYLLIGITISLGVMTAGPLVTFGFLVVPPLTARLLTRRMLAFSLLAAVARRRRGLRRLLGSPTAATCPSARRRWPSPASC